MPEHQSSSSNPTEHPSNLRMRIRLSESPRRLFAHPPIVPSTPLKPSIHLAISVSAPFVSAPSDCARVVHSLPNVVPKQQVVDWFWVVQVYPTEGRVRPRHSNYSRDQRHETRCMSLAGCCCRMPAVPPASAPCFCASACRCLLCQHLPAAQTST